MRARILKQQIMAADKAIGVGREAAAAQKPELSPIEKGARAWRGWFETWAAKP